MTSSPKSRSLFRQLAPRAILEADPQTSETEGLGDSESSGANDSGTDSRGSPARSGTDSPTLSQGIQSRFAALRDSFRARRISDGSRSQRTRPTMWQEPFASDPASVCPSPWNKDTFAPLSDETNFHNLMSYIIRGDENHPGHQLAAVKTLAQFLEENTKSLDSFYLCDGLTLMLVVGYSSSVLIQLQAARIALLLIEELSVQEVFVGEAGLGLLCMWTSSTLPNLRWMGGFCMIPLATMYFERTLIPPFDPHLIFYPIAQLMSQELPLNARKRALEAICSLSQCAEMRQAIAESENLNYLMESYKDNDDLIMSYVTEILSHFTCEDYFCQIALTSKEFKNCMINIAKIQGVLQLSHFTNIISNLLSDEALSVAFVKNGGIHILVELGSSGNSDAVKFAISTISLLVGMNNYKCDICGQSPIQSVRYQCLSCTDYNLCGKCHLNSINIFNNVHTSDHEMKEYDIGCTLEDDLSDAALVQFVISNCKSKEHTISWNCINILYRMSQYGSVSGTIIVLGGLDLLNQLGQSPSPFLRQMSRLTFCTLFTQDSCREFLIQNQTWRVLVSVLRSNDHISQIRAAQALKFLMSHMSDEYDTFLYDGILQSFVPLAYSENKQLQYMSAEWLTALSNFRSPVDADYFVDHGGYHSAIHLLENEQHLQKQASTILHNISRYQRGLLVKRGFLKSVLKIESENAEVLQNMAQIFLYLSKDGECMKHLCQSHEYLHYMCLCGKTDNQEIQYYILSGLFNITQSETFDPRVVESEILELLTMCLDSLMQQTTDSPNSANRIVRYRLVVRILNHFSRHVFYQQVLAAQGFVVRLLNSINSIDQEVSFYALDSLKNMCQEDIKQFFKSISVYSQGGPLSNSVLAIHTFQSLRSQSKRDGEIRVQCSYGASKYKFSITTPVLYDKLVDYVCKYYGFESKVQYHDDEGDLVGIRNQADLDEALRINFEVLKNESLELSIKNAPTPEVVSRSIPTSVVTLSPDDEHVISLSRAHNNIAAGNQIQSSSNVLADRRETLEVDGVFENFVFTGAQMSQIVHGELISRGAYSEVYRGLWRNEVVAIKKPLNYDAKGHRADEVMREAQMLKELKHPNIVTYLGASISNGSLYIITEYMPRGSLYQTLHKHGLEITLETRLQMALDTARGMRYLHGLNPIIIHRDLKSPNLLVDENWNVKVADFGLSCTKVADFIQSTMVGTVEWMAPEILHGDEYNEKVDIYSFGIILWELVTRLKPYRHQHQIQIVLDVVSKDLRPKIPPETPENITRLITDCWHKDASIRPSFITVTEALREINMLPPSSSLSW